jgi:hypothetical protein
MADRALADANLQRYGSLIQETRFNYRDCQLLRSTALPEHVDQRVQLQTMPQAFESVWKAYRPSGK